MNTFITSLKDAMSILKTTNILPLQIMRIRLQYRIILKVDIHYPCSLIANAGCKCRCCQYGFHRSIFAFTFFFIQVIRHEYTTLSSTHCRINTFIPFNAQWFGSHFKRTFLCWIRITYTSCIYFIFISSTTPTPIIIRSQ